MLAPLPSITISCPRCRHDLAKIAWAVARWSPWPASSTTTSGAPTWTP